MKDFDISSILEFQPPKLYIYPACRGIFKVSIPEERAIHGTFTALAALGAGQAAAGGLRGSWARHRVASAFVGA